MARKPRLYVPNVPQHVVQRGNNREPCFFAEEDCRYYLECLTDAAVKYGCDIHAYVLMTNHVHLLLTPQSEGATGAVMQSVGRRYVRHINHVYHRSGTLWEGRYKASLVDSEGYVLSCYRYIELNPVRANMVTHPGDYRWSSYGRNAHGQEDALLTPQPEYLRLGVNHAQRQNAYRELFRSGMDNELIHRIRGALNQGLVLGSDHFKDRVETMLNRRARPGQPGRPCVTGVKEVGGVYWVG